jgi:hypothetical protein
MSSAKKLILFISLSTIALCLLLINACKKENMAPGLVITSPVEMQDVATSDSILIAGTANDDHDLHEFYVVITNASGDTVGSGSPYVHGLKTYNFKLHFAPPDSGIYHLTLTMTDHDLARTIAQVDFHASHPARLYVVSPKDSSYIHPTDSILIAGFAVDEIGLHSMRFTGVSYLTGDTSFDQTVDISGSNPYNFNTYFFTRDTVPAADTGAHYVNVAVFNYKDEVTQKKIPYFVQ